MVPANPTPMPANCAQLGRRSAPVTTASNATRTGVVAFSTPATLESMLPSPMPKSVKGITAPATAGTAISAHVLRSFGSASRVTRQKASITAAPRTRRTSVIWIGESPVRAIFIHRKLDPQHKASKPSRNRLPNRI